MNVLIMVNHSFPSLQPLLQEQPVAILPVAGKTLLEHCLEAVTSIAPASVQIAASGDVLTTRTLISSGERWGLSSTVLPCKMNEDFKSVVARFPSLTENELLIVPADRIYLSTFADIISVLKDSSEDHPIVTCGKTGITLLRQTDSQSDAITVPGDSLQSYKVHSLADLHELNLSVVAGVYGQLKLRGKEISVGLRKGFSSRVHPRTIRSGHAFVGNHSRVHDTCQLSGNVMINHGVSVGRMTLIENSVVLDNTVVGDHLEVRNSVVCGNKIFRIDIDAELILSDRFLMSGREKALMSTILHPPLNKILGLIAFTLSTPIMLMGILVALSDQKSKVFQKRSFVGNKVNSLSDHPNTVNVYMIGQQDTCFHKLPMLFAVATGHLSLFGVSPLTPEEYSSRTQDWQMVRDKYPSGYFGHTQLYVGMSANLDERLLSDAIVAQTPMSWIERARILARSTVHSITGKEYSLNSF